MFAFYRCSTSTPSIARSTKRSSLPRVKLSSKDGLSSKTNRKLPTPRVDNPLRPLLVVTLSSRLRLERLSKKSRLRRSSKNHQLSKVLQWFKLSLSPSPKPSKRKSMPWPLPTPCPPEPTSMLTRLSAPTMEVPQQITLGLNKSWTLTFSWSCLPEPKRAKS